MTLRPGGKTVELLEQIIEDSANGITVQIEKISESAAVIRIFGDLQYGNSILRFRGGEHVGCGTFVSDCPKPTWVRQVSDTMDSEYR